MASKALHDPVSGCLSNHIPTLLLALSVPVTLGSWLLLKHIKEDMPQGLCTYCFLPRMLFPQISRLFALLLHDGVCSDIPERPSLSSLLRNTTFPPPSYPVPFLCFATPTTLWYITHVFVHLCHCLPSCLQDGSILRTGTLFWTCRLKQCGHRANIQRLFYIWVNGVIVYVT